MCGIAGVFHRDGADIDPEVIRSMTARIAHRGPDSLGFHFDRGLGLGFARLQIVGGENGAQPFLGGDGAVAAAVNGEIYNHLGIRAGLERSGSRFRTDSDCEVVLHLYQERGLGFARDLNGQFAYAIHDRDARALILGRDHFGIQSLYYAELGNLVVFASEIKAILAHPAVRPELDPIGLDQVVTFPGLVSPRTAFKGIRSLRPGHFMVFGPDGTRMESYWDMDYPLAGWETGPRNEDEAVEEFREIFERCVRRRVEQSDVATGLYLSGGTDSSLIAGTARKLFPRRPFPMLSIAMRNPGATEVGFQKRLMDQFGFQARILPFGVRETSGLLRDAVIHSETPLKESYNTASMLLSRTAREAGLKVILTGEGADELFGGYVGFRFDAGQIRRGRQPLEPEEAALRERLWGDATLHYEKNYTEFSASKRGLFSDAMAGALVAGDCTGEALIDASKVAGRHPIHQRSYLELKLRLADHLLAEHGERMSLSHSVEARYPFLDLEVAEFARRLSPEYKVRGPMDKFVVRRAAARLLPENMAYREKFHFTAPTTAALLQAGDELTADMLSETEVRKRGVFRPGAVGELVARFSRAGAELHFPYEDDQLMTVLTCHILMDEFNLPAPG